MHNIFQLPGWISLRSTVAKIKFALFKAQVPEVKI